jgi:hypothetical protein
MNSARRRSGIAGGSFNPPTPLGPTGSPEPRPTRGRARARSAWLCAAALLASLAGPAHAGDDQREQAEALARQVKMAWTARDEPGQLARLAGLRALRDPELRPLFSRLARSGPSARRAQATLALAELPGSKGLDMLLVRQLDPVGQRLVLGEAVELGLLSPEEIRDLLQWKDLSLGVYLSLLPRLLPAQAPADLSRLREIAGVQHSGTASVSTLLLLQFGQSDVPTGPLDRLLNEAGSPQGQQDLQSVLRFVRERRLASASRFVDRVLERYPDDRLLVFESVATLLVIDPAPARAADLWLVQFAKASDEGDRQRLVLAALLAASQRPEGLPASIIAKLNADAAPLSRASAAAAGALKSGKGLNEAVASLVALRHGPSLGWLLRLAEARSPEEARAIRLALVTGLGDAELPAALDARVVEAAVALAKDDPAALASVLDRAIAERDDAECRRLLDAALRSGNKATLSLVESRSWPGSGSGALALLIQARYAEKLTPEQREALARAALGSGGLGEAARVQAAWLSLERADQARPALARMLGELGPEAPAGR